MDIFDELLNPSRTDTKYGSINNVSAAYVVFRFTTYLGRFPFARPGRPKRTGSGQFKWQRSGRARTFFPATTLRIPALWPTEAGELSGSDA